MGVLYLTDQGSTLRKRGKRLVVEKQGQNLLELPVKDAERVVVQGYVNLTTPAIRLLLDMEVPTIFISQRGELKGCLQPLYSTNAPVRLQQFESCSHMKTRLSLSKQTIYAKLYNQARVLQKASFRRSADTTPELQQIRSLRDQLQGKRSLSRIRGLEGAASAMYFQGFGQILGLEGFTRSRRPPKDPVNSLLSFGYTLLVSECISALSIHGLDPYIGFYHSLKHGRPALALDIMEEFRHPFVDMVVLTLVSRNLVNMETGFSRQGSGVFMNGNTKKAFLVRYELAAKRFRPLIRKQAMKLVKFFKGESDYSGYRMG